VQLSKPTVDLLASLDAFSGRTLGRRDDLGTIIELDAVHGHHTLDELSFLAKFVCKTYGIMQRIGPQGKGYDKLSHEFGGAITNITQLISALLGNASTEDRQHVASTYLALTPKSLHHLLTLCYDLSWYKNWLIDHHAHPHKG
jgi:hypothetical protein